MNIIIKRFIAFALSFTLVIVPSFAADPNDYRKPNSWQRERTINDAVNKSTVKVEAQKTYPVSTLDQNGKPIKQMRKANATIKIKPTANKIGKTLMKRAPHSAIAYAVTSLLGRAVDWVLDPANNRVKYKELGGDFKDGVAYRPGPDPNGNYPTKQAACSAGLKFLPKDATWSFDRLSSDGQICIGTKTKDGVVSSNRNLYTVQEVKYDPPPEQDQDWRYISADELGAEVIKNADDGHSPSMKVMSDSANDALSAGELDSALDAASDIPQPDPQEITQDQYDNPNYPAPDTPTDPDGNTGGQTPNPDPENPNPEPTPTEWPAFCDWAFVVCDFIEWVKAEPEQTDTEIDLPEPDEQPTDTNFNFGGSCPAPIVFKGSIFGQSIEFTMLDTVMLCDFLSTYVKWPVYAASSLFAIYIVGGRKEDG
ncbi:hypothetical protein [Psychrobacter celer]|uniref:hypothetical protein n=1 Tax=Psychrobacter celer TaxID=306572 RepID=UPI003FCF15C4